MLKSNVVVVAVDSSENAEQAFKWACNNISNSILDIVHAVPHVSLPTSEDDPQRLSDNRMVFEKYRKMCREAGRNCSFCEIAYRPTSLESLGRRICSHAEKEKARGVVLGARGKEPKGRAQFGSTSYSVLQECECPVVVVKESDKDKEKEKEKEQDFGFVRIDIDEEC